MPLCNTAVTGPWTARLRRGQVGARGLCLHLLEFKPWWSQGNLTDAWDPSRLTLSLLKAGGNLLLSPKIFCPPVWRSVSWASGGLCNLRQAVHACMLAGGWAAFPLPSVPPFGERLFKSCIYEVTLKWQVKTSRSVLCDCCSPRVGLAPGLGPSCHKAPGGWHGGFTAEPKQDC